MAFNRGPQEPIPEEETAIWTCTNEACSGWMRADFSFDDHPTCPLCHSEMKKEMRILPVIH